MSIIDDVKQRVFHFPAAYTQDEFTLSIPRRKIEREEWDIFVEYVYLVEQALFDEKEESLDQIGKVLEL
jgi:hypothetical protein